MSKAHQREGVGSPGIQGRRRALEVEAEERGRDPLVQWRPRRRAPRRRVESASTVAAAVEADVVVAWCREGAQHARHVAQRGALDAPFR